jgi:hypothetical protein
MQQQWRLRIRGKQRKQVDAKLLIAAVIALGEQLQAEQREQEQAAAEARQTPACRPPEVTS